MITRVYIAAPWQMRDEAKRLARNLETADIGVTSRWLTQGENLDHETADMDLADIRAAQAVVLINPPQWAKKGSGGRHVEVGYVLALNRPIYVLGAKSNIFHELNTCHVISSSTDLVTALRNTDVDPFPIYSSKWMLQQLILRVHAAHRQWWRDLETGAPITRNVGELLMLVVSELAEAMEGHRKNLPDDKLPHRPMFTVEIADALIRLLDLAGGLTLDVPDAFEEKMAFNAVRVDHTAAHRQSAHGKK